MSGIVAFLFICLLVGLASAKVAIQGKVSRMYFHNTQDSVLFNGILFLAIALCIALVFPMIKPTSALVLSALAVSGFTFLFQTTYALAMGTGPVSLTVLIVCFSLFIPLVSSVILYGEKIYLTQMIGTVFLILSMLLNLKTEKDENGNKKKISWKWLLFTFGALAANGTATALQKTFGKSNVGIAGADTTFLSLIYLFAGILAFLFYFSYRLISRNKAKASYRIDKRLILFIVLIALILSVFQKCYMHALVHIDAAVLLPTYNGLHSVLMTFIGILSFKDKLTVRQKLGILCGIICVILMNLQYGFSI